jgi:hypothetical protein
MHALFTYGVKMSTKIFNGVMLNGVYTIQDMYDFVDSIRGPVKEAVYMDRAREILATSTLIYDMYHVMGQDYFNPDEDQRIPLLVASKRHVRLPPDEASDYSVAIGIVDGYTLAMFFFDDRTSEKIFLDHPQVQYFGYWNNADPDENVTEQEWSLRKDLWNRMFDHNTRSSFPSEAMFVQRIMSNRYIMPEDKHMEAAIPSLEERRKSVIRNVSFALAKEELASGAKDGADTQQNLKDIFNRAEEKRTIATQAVPVNKFAEKMSLAMLSKEIPVTENNNKEEQDGSDGISETSSED